MLCKKSVLTNFSKFSGKRLQPATLLKKRFLHRCLPLHFAKFLRTSFLIERLRWGADCSWKTTSQRAPPAGHPLENSLRTIASRKTPHWTLSATQLNSLPENCPQTNAPQNTSPNEEARSSDPEYYPHTTLCRKITPSNFQMYNYQSDYKYNYLSQTKWRNTNSFIASFKIIRCRL